MNRKDKTVRWIYSTLLMGLVFAIGCEPDLEPNDPIDNNLRTILEPDEALDYFSFSNATKITGSLPTAIDGGLKTNVQDTMFAVRGHSAAAPRMIIKHDVGVAVAGYNIITSGATYYYHVPKGRTRNGEPTSSSRFTCVHCIGCTAS